MAELIHNPLFALFVLVVILGVGYVIVRDENVPAFLYLFFASLGALVTMTGFGQIGMLKTVLLPLLWVILVAKSLKNGRPIPLGTFFLLGAYILAVYVSGTINGIPLSDYRGELGILVIAAVVALAPSKPETFSRLIWAIAIWGVVNALVVISTWLGIRWGGVYGNIYNEGGRAVGLMRHSTFMGIYFAIALLAVQILYICSESRLMKFLYLSAGMLIFLGMLNALSRGAVAGWLAGFLFIQYRLKGLRIQNAIGIAVLGGIAMGLGAMVDLDELMLGRFQNIESDNSAQARIPLVMAALNAFLSSPFFGVGVGWEDTSMRLEAHNMFMQVLVEVGLIGCALFVVLTWRGGWRLLKGASRKHEVSREVAIYRIGLVAMFGAILVDSITHSFDYFMPYWILLGIGFMI